MRREIKVGVDMKIHRIIKKKACRAKTSVSAIVNQALLHSFSHDTLDAQVGRDCMHIPDHLRASKQLNALRRDGLG